MTDFLATATPIIGLIALGVVGLGMCMSSLLRATNVLFNATLVVSLLCLMGALVVAYAGQAIRSNRLSDAVLAAVEAKYDVNVERHENYTSWHKYTAALWTIDGTAQKCMFEVEKHFDSGNAVIDFVAVVCEGTELPLRTP